MSPLVRPLLALATVALFATALAEDEPLRRRMFSGGFGGTPAACSELTMGLTPDHNQFIRKVELNRMHADPPKNSTHKFNIIVPNEAKTGEVLVGQRLMVCDFKSPKNSVDVNFIKPDLHSPLTVTCRAGCPDGVEIIADQYVITKLT